MAFVSLRLPDDVSSRLQHLVDLTGRSKTFCMVQAINDHLDDLEDLDLAEQRLIDLRAGRAAGLIRGKEWSATLAWRIEFKAGARKDPASMDKQIARRIVAFLGKRVRQLDDMRSIGEALSGSKLG